MSDVVDRASAYIESAMQDFDRRQSACGAQRQLVAGTGQCLYCTEPLPLSQRWCDIDCRDEWERVQDAHRRAHGPR